MSSYPSTLFLCCQPCYFLSTYLLATSLSKSRLSRYPQEQVTSLLLRVESLEHQLAQNSRNSNRPPSGDVFNKPSPSAMPRVKGRKQGGQPGHTGHTLDLSATPDEVIDLVSEACACGHRFTDSEQSASFIQARQDQDEGVSGLAYRGRGSSPCVCFYLDSSQARGQYVR